METSKVAEKDKQILQSQEFVDARKVRGVGFEPTNPYGTAASGLRL